MVSNDNKDREESIRKKLFNTRGEDVKVKGCVYCGDADHKAIQCEKIVETSERKKILARKGLCFNCVVKPHRAADCPRKSSCQHCLKRHHSSICDKRPADGKTLMTDGASDDGIFPVVVQKVQKSATKGQFERQNNRIKVNQPGNFPKKLTPCPFLSRRGWCVKGNRCDFQHPSSLCEKYRHTTPCPFLQRKGYCVKGDQCDFSHEGLYYEMKRHDPEYPCSFLPQYPRVVNPINIQAPKSRTKWRPPNYLCKTQLHHQLPIPPLMEIPVQPPFHRRYRH